MESRVVEAVRGWRWIVEGFALFRRTPLIWVVLTIVLFAIAFGLGKIPLIGQFVFYLLSPVFLAGLMIGCRDLERGEELEIGHLVAGFRHNTSQLITLGGVYLVGQVLIFGVLLLIGGAALMEAFNAGPKADPQVIMNSLGPITFALLVAFSLSVPLMMAIWFAPLLVVFDSVPPVAALKASFLACLKNMLPFLVYGAALVLLAFIAAIPFGLGFLVLFPTIFGSLYASYKDVFRSDAVKMIEGVA
jgi:hypothetical protein